MGGVGYGREIYVCVCVCVSVYSILRCDRSALYGGQRATERLTGPPTDRPSERAAETYSVPGISTSIQDANRRWLRGTTNKFGGGGSGVGYKISTSSTHPARFRSENSKLAHARMSERKEKKGKNHLIHPIPMRHVSPLWRLSEKIY